MPKTNTKLFKVKYYFDGNGEVSIRAKNKQDAESKFFDGDWDNEAEDGDNYTINTIEER